MRCALLFSIALFAACHVPDERPEQALPDSQPAAHASDQQSVKPGINETFLDPDLDVDKYVQRFEAESREVFAKRTAIARAVGLQEGMAIADVGAGTGLFLDFFAREVKASGKVYAVEIAPKFIDRLRARFAERAQTQMEVVKCTERNVSLPEGSVDTVFACDTYHHFEYPDATLASIHRALRSNGTLVIVDFERVPGKSRPWLLDHVRCGKVQVIKEVVAAGFEIVEEVQLGFDENYFLRFRKR